MKMWIARTIGRDLQLFPEEPFYREEYDIWYYWKAWTPSSHMLSEGSLIDPSLFPEVTFENSPMEVELKLIEK
jgi:hypothetical protein